MSPELHFRLSQAGVFRGEPHRAGHGQLQPAAQRKAVHGRHRWLAASFEPAEGRLSAQREGARFHRRKRRQFGDIRARHESLLARAGDDGGADRPLRGDALERVRQFGHHRGGKRVELLRAG